MDRETNRSRGFGFVEMADEDARKAIDELTGADMGGRAITVNEARPRAPRPPRADVLAELLWDFAAMSHTPAALFAAAAAFVDRTRPWIGDETVESFAWSFGRATVALPAVVHHRWQQLQRRRLRRQLGEAPHERASES